MENKEKLGGMLGLAAKAGNVVAGSQVVLETLAKRKVKLLLLAEDASERTKEIFQKEGKEKNIPVQECLTSEEIGRRIGKSKKAIIGISDENFAKAIYKILSGGEAIG